MLLLSNIYAFTIAPLLSPLWDDWLGTDYLRLKLAFRN